MKFLPALRPAILVAVGIALGACHSVTDTPANRRQLYNNTYDNSGVWHDYTRRREAEMRTGVSGGTSPSVVPGRAPGGAPPATAPGAPGTLPPGTTVAEPGPQAPLAPAGVPAALPPPVDAAPTIPGVDATAAPATTPDASVTTPAPE